MLPLKIIYYQRKNIGWYCRGQTYVIKGKQLQKVYIFIGDSLYGCSTLTNKNRYKYWCVRLKSQVSSTGKLDVHH